MNRIFTYLIVITMFVMTADAFAKINIKNPETILKCYEKSLTDENEGVVKSVILNIMKMKTVYPELEYSKIIKKLEKLSCESQFEQIRYKAYMAVNFLKYPEQLKWNLPARYEDLDDFFQNYKIVFDSPVAQTN